MVWHEGMEWLKNSIYLLWLLSGPACAEVNQAMQELTGINYNTGEQNKDMTAADKHVTGKTQ